MHINSLKIQGFKSYRDETIVDPFSAGLNLLVGRNGSGKSNFFSAIRFVLSDAYTSLSREERQALLHDGSTGGGGGGGVGGATMSAFVEIEFDNSDGRFPTNKPTLLLRRTIGLKKDEYQLDRKSTSKGEVMSILESAGFSRSNPYYIVPQGRITHLTNQKDQDRLALLKEVAGTKVYEERRAESTKIMDETQSKRDKINESLEFINARLAELEEEKEELKQFQVQDRTRRSLQYQILQRELKDISEGLDTVEEERRRDVDNANTRRTEFNAREKDMAALEEKIMSEKQALELLTIEHRQSSADRRDAVKAKAQVECIVQDAEEAGQKGKDKLNKFEKELQQLEATIVEKETELMEVTPDYEDRLTEEVAGKEKLEAITTTLRTLYAKQGRTSQFKNQKDRDSHLKSSITNNSNLIVMRQKAVDDGKKELSKAKRDLDEAVENVKSLREENDGRKQSLIDLSEELASLKLQEGEASEKRKNLWKEDSRMQSQVKHASEQLKNAERTMAATMDRDTSKGLKSAKAIAERLGMEGYYGPLCELFTVEDRYKTAVEVTAGTSLFQIVVDNDDTATKILDIMIKEHGGRVTFMPLNRLKVQAVEFPKAKEAIAMITKLTFDKKFALAFDQVFGRTIICQTLEIAGAYTRSHGLNSITLEGDKYDRKGSLTGGFHDVRHSRLDAVKNLKEWQDKFERAHNAVEEGKAAISKIDQEITQLVGKAQIIEGKRARVQDGRESLIKKILDSQTDEERLRQRVSRLEASVLANESSIRNLGVEVEALQAELKTKMEDTLSNLELQKLADLNAESDQTKKDLLDLSKSVSKLATKKNLLEIELNERLRRRREELRGKIESCEVAGPANEQNEDIAARKQELKRLERSTDDLTEKLDAAEAKTAEVTALLAQLEKEREKKEGQQEEDGRSIQRQQKTVERYLHKRGVMIARKDTANKNIRDLGVLPEEAFVETNANTDKLVKKLHKVMHALEGFTHVNKKAYEQYTTFTKQRDDLIARQTELDDSSQSILDLIDHLDRRKDEAIERTFKQVAKYFEEVFEKLVPAGRGRLIMQRREVEQAEDDMDIDEAEVGGVESYTGVAIRVSFNSKSNEGLKIQQLSGGQKALVALAMIFAIQKCDPAPFYLFDEIDANLDADRRTGVAAMINELSQTGQYICTTFRPELIPHADAFFGVIFDASKISNVKKITAEECMEFVDAADAVRA